MSADGNVFVLQNGIAALPHRDDVLRAWMIGLDCDRDVYLLTGIEIERRNWFAALRARDDSSGVNFFSVKQRVSHLPRHPNHPHRSILRLPLNLLHRRPPAH